MIGAGVFAAIGPAAEAAGTGLVVGLAIAAAAASCNAASSAALAAVHPASGGAYVYGREQLAPFWGHLAGWGFVVGKSASCAALALTIGSHVAPSLQRPIALGAVGAVAAVNHLGIRKTAAVTRTIVVLVLVTLAVVVVAAVASGDASTAAFDDLGGRGLRGILESAGLLFFAFAGYARVATLGEEVRDPARTIPKAIALALGITLLVYAAVALSAIAAAGSGALAASDAPLATVLHASDASALVPAVRVAGTIAAVGVLLSLLAGVSRTAFAMAADHELPRWLDAVHPTRHVPHRSGLAVAAVVAVLVTISDLRGTIGFSSFCVLTYYAVANASAWTLPPEHRRWPRAVAGAGLIGCAALALTLSLTTIVAGVAVLGLGALARAIRLAVVGPVARYR